MLTVYKASAGSGKTFQLVVEYIRLLMKNPGNYRHILAVTFTNKATNEMKTRILEQLNKLATNQPSDYIPHLQEGTNFSEGEIRAKAKEVLKNILHDYNRFSISTIDSFTQRTIKAFNREMGISPNFTLELDSDLILAEATDRLLAKIHKDKKLLKWLKSFSKEKIEDNKSQRIDDSIKSLGKELFKEKFQVFFPEDGDSVYSRKNLKSFGKELNRIKMEYENTLINLGKKGVQIISENGLTPDDFAGKSRGIGSHFEKQAKGLQPNITKTVEEAAVQTEKWYTKTSDKRVEIHALAESELQPLLAQILNFISVNEEKYTTAILVLRQFRTLGILIDLKEEIKSLLREKGVLQLSDANLLLYKIIGQSDSPFIYEKTGNYYHHFMLDEFQDTSGLQWKNFKPLISNSLAEGYQNLLVGDVKQSIYRWRNSDWNILAEQINQEFFESQRNNKTLVSNWRSKKNIIGFNNSVFENLKEVFEAYQFRGIDDPSNGFLQKFQGINQSISQKQGKPDETAKGFVNIRFLPGEDFEDHSSDLLVEQVKLLQDNGIKASDIAILIRANREGAVIIEKFQEAAKQPENENYNLSVISNESLFLYASQGVLLIINVIKILIDADNEIAKVALLNQWMNWLNPELHQQGAITGNQLNFDFKPAENQEWKDDFQQLFESELAGKLQKIRQKVLLSSLDETITQIASLFQLFVIESELPFIQTFIDKAGELKTTLSNDLSNLLFWWEEEGFSASVNVNEEVDSIRLLTVHKSKGLEFAVVLIPFFNWKTGHSGYTAPMLWVEPKLEPFNRFPVLPVKHSSVMQKSQFRAEYNEEIVNSTIDVFNLIYVAFTRAKSTLLVNCPEPVEPKTPSDSGKPVHYLLMKALEKMAEKEEFSACFNEERSSFQRGELRKSIPESKASNSVIMRQYYFNDFSERVKLRLSGDDFLMTSEQHHSIKNTGKIIHEILAEIRTAEDLEKACKKAVIDGKINESEEREILENLKNQLEKPVIKNWFDGSYNILNERSLLKPDAMLRPDRIMISENKAVVVDYKTGDSKLEKYNRQVIKYAETLKESGFEKVDGYLWYTGMAEVEKVCEF